MAMWSQVFDDDEALGEARRRARGLLVGFALASGLLVSAAPLAAFAFRTNGGAVALGCGALLTVCAVLVVRRLSHEHRRVWRVELSVSRFVAHDAAGRRRSLRWDDVRALDVTTAGLVVTGRDEAGARASFVVRAAMPAYTAFAHRAVEYAEAHGRPVSVDGTPVAALDLAALDSTLCEVVGGSPARPHRRAAS